MKKIPALCMSAALIVGLAEPFAAAVAQPPAEQEPAAETAEPSRGANLLDEVIVTASKRSESSRDVPAGITALSGEQLETLGASRFEDFAYFVPGLSWGKFDSIGGQQLSLRGVSTGFDQSATVGVYVDDVPIGSSSSYANGGIKLDLATFDLERVEVLHGPQGTLYGASTLGGLVKYVTRDPDFATWSAKAAGEISYTQEGTLNHITQGLVNIPLKIPGLDSPWAMRIGASRLYDGGFIDSPVIGQKQSNANTFEGIRAVVLGEPRENLTVRLSGMFQQIKGEGLLLTGRHLRTHEPTPFGPYDHNNRMEEPGVNRVPLVSASLDWDLGWAQLLSVSNWQGSSTETFIDITDLADGVLMTGENVQVAIHYNFKLNKWVQEFRLSSPSNQKLEWIAGAFVTHEKGLYDVEVYRFDTESGDVVNPGDSIPVTTPVDTPGVRFFDSHVPTKFLEFAGFGNLTWYFTEKFDLTVGGRFANNRQDFHQVSSGALDADPVFGTDSRNKSKEKIVTWLVNPRYRLDSDSLFYGRVATGYRPGGPNVVINPPTGQDTPGRQVYDPDTLINYEVGMKSAFFDGTFIADLAVFQIDWDNIQLSVVRDNFTVRENGGSARIRGAELATRFGATRALTLGMTFAYLVGKLTEDAPAIPAKKGDQLPRSAKYSGTLTGDYRFGLPWGLWGNAFASYRYVGDRESSFTGSTATPRYELRAYDLWDARLSASGKNYSVTLFGRNLLDQIGETSGSSVFAGESDPDKPVQVVITQPRTIGVSVSYEFY